VRSVTKMFDDLIVGGVMTEKKSQEGLERAEAVRDMKNKSAFSSQGATLRLMIENR